MKKILYAAAFLASMTAALAVHAAPGDIAGEIYSTDILAVVNGEMMESYNIGGRTAVIAEELDEGGYGFRHSYDDSTRTLYLQSGSNTNVGDKTVERGTVGEIVGNIYETDIKVILNGTEIPGYNIGGRTAIVIEDMGVMDGSNANEQYGWSKYLCNFTWDEPARTITLNSFTENGWYDNFLPYITYKNHNNIITASYSPDEIYAMGLDRYFDEDVYSEKLYQIEPVYLDLNSEMTQVGLTYFYPDIIFEHLTSCMNIDFDKLNSLTASLKPEDKPSYEEITAKFGNTENYRIVSECETPNFKCMFVEHTSDNSIQLISAAKSGGYITLAKEAGNYQIYEVEAGEGDKVIVTYGPTAGPRGEQVNISTEYDLTWYQY